MAVDVFNGREERYSLLAAVMAGFGGQYQRWGPL